MQECFAWEVFLPFSSRSPLCDFRFALFSKTISIRPLFRSGERQFPSRKGCQTCRNVFTSIMQVHVIFKHLLFIFGRNMLSIRKNSLMNGIKYLRNFRTQFQKRGVKSHSRSPIIGVSVKFRRIPARIRNMINAFRLNFGARLCDICSSSSCEPLFLCFPKSFGLLWRSVQTAPQI